MMDQKFLSLLMACVLLISCGEDEETTNNNDTKKIGSYTLEISGSENYTLEGNAIMGRPYGDTAVAVGLEKRNSTPSGLSSSITFNVVGKENIYQSKEISIKSAVLAPPYAQVVGAINNEPLVGLSGTMNISDGRKEGFLDATFSFTAKYGSGRDIDTVQGSGTFRAEDPNN